MAEDVHTHIEALVAEEHRLWEHEASGNASESDRRRLAEIKVELDRYWDLLRRRRSAADAGRQPRRRRVAQRGHGRGLPAVAAERRSTQTLRIGYKQHMATQPQVREAAEDAAAPARRGGRPRSTECELADPAGDAGAARRGRASAASRSRRSAARAGVAKTTIYRRWRDKDELALAVVLDMVEQVVMLPELGDTRAELLAFVNAAVRCSDRR